MKLSTRTRYGLRALIDLAKQPADGPVMLRKISERQGISKKYLDNIFTSLRLSGHLRTVRGASGGYLLAEDPSKIPVSHLVRALEGNFSPVDCINQPELCEKSEHCVARRLWKEMEKAMYSVLDAYTLQDLVERHQDLDTVFCIKNGDGPKT